MTGAGARVAGLTLDRARVVGILNVTPDSFSDGGAWFGDLGAVRARAQAMRAEGADIIDVGGESTRPGADAVTVAEELRRVIPVVEALAAGGLRVSIDTRRPEVMRAALAAGAAMINDVAALRQPGALEAVAPSEAAVVLMHAPGAGEDLHAGVGYDDVVEEVTAFLRDRRDAALAAGIAADRIVLDPGIGFGKSVADNLALIRDLPRLAALGQPLLVGASRKRLIAALAGDAPPDRRLGGSLALALAAADGGAALVRVHDVAETAQALAVWRGLH